jgi:2-oxoglutarate ferredoxin oxidoreductase subunit beta
MTEALTKPGFTFVEVITPCATLYARRNRLGSGFDLMKFYRDHSEIDHGADTREVGIGYQSKMILGKFVDRERPTWIEVSDAEHDRKLGERYYRHRELSGEPVQEVSDAKA